jgi:hypothetical protein
MPRPSEVYGVELEYWVQAGRQAYV